MLKLKNGTEYLEPLAKVIRRVISMGFNGLAQRDPIAVYEPVMKSRGVVLSSSEGLDVAVTSPFVAEEQEARTEIPEVLQNEEELKTYFSTVFAIGHHIIDVMRENGIDVFDVLLDTESPNPVYDRIPANGGVALRYSFGLPSSFMTPLGKLQIRGGCSRSGDAREKVNEALHQSLGLKEVIPKKISQTTGEQHGPVYQITKDLNGSQLPKAELEGKCVEFRLNYSGWDNCETITNLWEKVKPKSVQQDGGNFDLSGGPG